jgi:hypothetical protein
MITSKYHSQQTYRSLASLIKTIRDKLVVGHMDLKSTDYIALFVVIVLWNVYINTHENQNNPSRGLSL